MPGTTGIVVPAYRPDVSVLRRHIERLRAAIDPRTIVVALDDPRPGIPAKLRESGVTVDVSPTRRGKGTAVSMGFDRLGTDRLAFSDADASTPPESLLAVVEALDQADVAVGSRRHPDATVKTHQSLVRRRLGDGFAYLARQILDLSLYDFQCGAKAMTAETWQRLRQYVTESGFGWDVEMLGIAHAMDCRIVEVPVEWRDRPESSVPPLRTALNLLHVLATTRIRASGLDAAVGSVNVEERDRSTQVRSDGAGK